MYFSSIYNTVLKKLAKNKDENSLKSLTEKLEKNPIYKHQFDILNFVRESKIENNEDLNNLVKTIVRKNHKFIKEKKVTHIDVWKENKKLLEFYNISSLEVIPNVLDKAIDLNINKGLNESALRSFFKDKIKETKEFTKKELIQENFNYIYKYDDKHQFKTNMSIIQFLSENINDKDKIFINESLNKIKATYKNKFKESVGNLYKLRLLTEKFLKEFHLEDEEDFEEFGDEEPDEPKTSPGKKLSLKDLKYIKRITVETPKNFQNPSQIIISFKIPFYPVGGYYSDLKKSAIHIKNRLTKFRRSFINLFIYQKDRTNLFDPIGTIWDVTMRDTSGFKFNKEVPGRVRIFLHTNKKEGNTWDNYWKASYAMIKEFDNMLSDLFPDELNIEAQKAAVQNRDPESQRNVKTNRDMYNDKPDVEDNFDIFSPVGPGSRSKSEEE